MITTHMNPATLRTDATKTVRCVCNKTPKAYFFNNESKLWQCPSCGHSCEPTEKEIKKYTFKSNTVVLMNYLLSMGYPVVDVALEVKPTYGQAMAGAITIIDTNSNYDPKKPRRVLEVEVQTIGKKISYMVLARKFTTKGKATGKTTYFCDDLLKLNQDLETQRNIADLVVNVLGVKTKDPIFDVKELDYMIDVESAEIHLDEAKEALAQYRKEANAPKKGGRKC